MDFQTIYLIYKGRDKNRNSKKPRNYSLSPSIYVHITIHSHYKKRADSWRAFFPRSGGNNRPKDTTAEILSAPNFPEETLRRGGKLYAVALKNPPARVAAELRGGCKRPQELLLK